MSPSDCLHPLGKLRQLETAPLKDQCYCSACGEGFSYADVLGYAHPDFASRAYAFTRAVTGLIPEDSTPLLHFMAPGAVRARMLRLQRIQATPQPQKTERDPVWRPDPQEGIK
jgi:hypothetical protein